MKLLADKNVVSPSEFKLAKAKMAATRSAINGAKATLTKSRFHVSLPSIRAPFDGVINRILFKRGSLIEEGALLTSISDLREMYAYFNVSEKEYLSFIKKRRYPEKVTIREVDLLLGDDSLYPYKGKTETTETEFPKTLPTKSLQAIYTSAR